MINADALRDLIASSFQGSHYESPGAKLKPLAET